MSAIINSFNFSVFLKNDSKRGFSFRFDVIIWFIRISEYIADQLYRTGGFNIYVTVRLTHPFKSFISEQINSNKEPNIKQNVDNKNRF